MPDERQQFRVLYRAFLSRLIDFRNALLAGTSANSAGAVRRDAGTSSFVVVVVRVPRFGLSNLPPEELAIAAWGDEHFLISTTVAIVGLFAAPGVVVGLLIVAAVWARQRTVEFA